MSEIKARDISIGDQVPEQTFLAETMGQALSMIDHYGRIHDLSPAAICRIFNAGIGALVQSSASGGDGKPRKVWIGSGDA